MRTIAGTTWTVEEAQAYIRSRVRVDENGCWIWQRYVHHTGYGHHRAPGASQVRRAHRTAFESFAGPIPDGLLVCHRCDVPTCCNPEHLFLGTNAENIADMVDKGRQRAPRGEANGRAKLTKEQIAEIRSRYSSGASLQRELAAEFGISQQHVCNVVRGKKWAAVLAGLEAPR